MQQASLPDGANQSRTCHLAQELLHLYRMQQETIVSEIKKETIENQMIDSFDLTIMDKN